MEGKLKYERLKLESCILLDNEICPLTNTTFFNMHYNLRFLVTLIVNDQLWVISAVKGNIVQKIVRNNSGMSRLTKGGRETAPCVWNVVRKEHT